jgi:flavin reductase (DIM6/NTAB) family NADH-FMN oxidoreductase RutF
MSSDTHKPSGAPLGPEDFRRAAGRFATGVAVATVVDSSGDAHGLTVSSVASVSLEPPLLLFSIGHSSSSLGLFRSSKYFVLNILGDDQREISDRFARKGHDRFGGLEWRAGQTGAPLIRDALAHIECSVFRRITAGDHDIIIGEALAAHTRSGDPLIHHAGRYRKLAP